ncbi:unnamed protein product [Didymodactylos carnosus]|uniref:Cytochrome P450 n=1 Tax=Didymodactylos carnosus TaxID=1234261 RepID=A0A815H653_9BILA|nr:unnamed protein product [Didymodactylos carnosus]CAF4215211.1 unnamed protein product [Didymodactylos carnosus]
MYDEHTFLTKIARDPKFSMEFLDDLSLAGGVSRACIKNTRVMDEIIKQFHTYLFGDELEQLNKSVYDCLIDKLKVRSTTTNIVNVFDYFGEMMFYAAATTLFGKTFVEQQPGLYQSYLEFNHALGIILMKIPMQSFFLYPVIKKRNEYIKRFENLKINDEQSKIVQARIEFFASDENKDVFSKQDTSASHGLLLWAAVVNTVTNSIWALVDLLIHPEAISAVKQELKTIDINQLYERETLNKLQILDSCINETLRRTVLSMSTREATENITITDSDGTLIGLRKHDILAYPSLVKHYDSDLFPQPYTFQYNRFVKEQHQQNGKKIPSTIVFGCGKRMCPGRYWAVNEIKMLLALVITNMNIELLMDESYRKKLCERLEYQYTGVLSNGGPIKQHHDQFKIKYSCRNIDVN